MISVRRNHDLQFNYFNNIFSRESLWKKPIQSQNMAKWFLSFNHSYAKAHLIFQQNRDELVKMRLQEGRGVGADGGGCGVREKPRFCWAPRPHWDPGLGNENLEKIDQPLIHVNWFWFPVKELSGRKSMQQWIWNTHKSPLKSKGLQTADLRLTVGNDPHSWKKNAEVFWA